MNVAFMISIEIKLMNNKIPRNSTYEETRNTFDDQKCIFLLKKDQILLEFFQFLN